MANVILAVKVVVVGRDWCDRGLVKAALIVPTAAQVVLQLS